MSDILLVVGTAGTPTSGDNYVKAILEGLGHTVTLRSDDDADSVSGFSGVVCAESCASGTLGTKYASAAVPVVTHESGHVDGMGLISAEAANTQTTDTINVIAPTHPMMDGPFGSLGAGTHTVLSSAVSFSYLDLSGAVDLATGVTGVADLNTSEWWTALAADAPDFPARRAYIWPTTGASSPIVTGDGEIALKNTYAWLFAGQILLPDADVAAGGWATSPLFSKVNDGSDATVISATAS